MVIGRTQHTVTFTEDATIPDERVTANSRKYINVWLTNLAKRDYLLDSKVQMWRGVTPEVGDFVKETNDTLRHRWYLRAWFVGPVDDEQPIISLPDAIAEKLLADHPTLFKKVE